MAGAFAVSVSVSVSVAQSYGAGCGGDGGQVPVVAIVPGMRPGFASTLTVSHLPPNYAAVLMLGASSSHWGAIALPLSFAPFGMPGCELLVGPEVTIPFATGGGTAACTFGVPLSPALAAHWLYLQVLFDQPGLNAAGFGLSRGLAARIAPLPAPTSWVTSIVQHGITFQFAAPVQAGRFVNGDWFVIGPATLTGMQPPCQVVGGRTINGAMIDPAASTQQHGYDSSLFDPPLYSNSRNVAWNLSPGNPRTLRPNQSLVKVVSEMDPNTIPVLDTCAVLTVLAETPPEGSFRPPYSGTDHAVRFDEQMIDWSLLLALSPAAGMPDIATQTARFERPWLDHAPGWPSRYLHPVQNMPDYGRDFATLYNEAALLCHLNVPLNDKRLLAIRLVQIGSDFHGNVTTGCYWEGVGGHGSGRKLPILFAGALLHDADMLDVGHDYPSERHLNGTYTTHFGEDCQTFYVQQTSATQINWGHGGFTSVHLGLPEFGFSHVHYPVNDNVAWLGDSYRRCCTANAWIGAVLCARMMGLIDEWDHPALFDYTDRFAQTEPSGWTRSWSTWVGHMWDQYRPLY